MRRTGITLALLAVCAVAALPASATTFGRHGPGAAQFRIFSYSTAQLDALSLTGDFPRQDAAFAGTVSLASPVSIEGHPGDAVRAVGPFPVTGSSVDGSQQLGGMCSGTFASNEGSWSQTATGNWWAVIRLTCTTAVNSGPASISHMTIFAPTSTGQSAEGGRGEEVTFYGIFT